MQGIFCQASITFREPNANLVQEVVSRKELSFMGSAKIWSLTKRCYRSGQLLVLGTRLRSRIRPAQPTPPVRGNVRLQMADARKMRRASAEKRVPLIRNALLSLFCHNSKSTSHCDCVFYFSSERGGAHHIEKHISKNRGVSGRLEGWVSP